MFREKHYPLRYEDTPDPNESVAAYLQKTFS